MNFDELPEEVRNLIPQEHRDSKVMADIPDIPALIKSHIETKTHVGKLSTQLEGTVRVPSQDASAEAHTEFMQGIIDKVPNLMVKPVDAESTSAVFRAMGKPEKSDEYKLHEIEGLTIDDTRQNMLKDAALSNDLTKSQFEGMSKILLESDKAMIDQGNTDRAAQVKLQQEKWGMAYPDHMGKAVAAFNAASGNNVESLNPEMAEVFYNVSKQLGIQAPQVGDQVKGNSAQGFSPQEATIRMAEIMANKEHIMHQPKSEARDAYLNTEWKQLNIAAST